MKKQQKNEKKLSGGQLILLLAAIALGLAAIGMCALLFSGCSAQPVAEKNPKYVFLFLGDGMGTNQVAATRYLQAARDGGGDEGIWSDTSFDSFPVVGLMSTHSLEQPTDSAAAITAMLTGQKVYNGALNFSRAAGGARTPFAALAKERGYAVGVVTSISVDHATPAGVYATAESRYDYKEIAPQGIAENYLDFLGGGGFHADTRETLLPLAEQNGFAVFEGAEAIRALEPVDAPVLALAYGGLDGYDLPYEIDRVRAAQYGGTELSLAELLSAAVRQLETKDRFFLLCEGAKIDVACAEGDLAGALYEVQALDDAVRAAVAFYEQHPEDTLIVTLADHETGGLRIKGGADFSALLPQVASARRFRSIMKEIYAENGGFDAAMEKAEHYFGVSLSSLSEEDAAELEEAFEASLESDTDAFTAALCGIMQKRAKVALETGNHTGQPVAVYAMGAMSDTFSGVYDNTEIYAKLRMVLGIEE